MTDNHPQACDLLSFLALAAFVGALLIMVP